MYTATVAKAYTSKTRSWDGTVNARLGGARVIWDESGFGMDRDVNGARGIFLRAVGDSPFLRGLLTQVASQTNSRFVERCLAFNYRSGWALDVHKVAAAARLLRRTPRSV